MNRLDGALAVHPGVATILPVIVHADDPRHHRVSVLDPYFEDLLIAYSFGPPFGRRFLRWADLDGMRVTQRQLHRDAAANLDASLDRVQVYGMPPALMLSFDGVESSLLLSEAFMDNLARSVPGDLVVGVPARDVVIVTGSQSRPGLAKARRAVDRVFFAGNQNLLLRDLLVRRHGRWEMFG